MGGFSREFYFPRLLIWQRLFHGSNVFGCDCRLNDRHPFCLSDANIIWIFLFLSPSNPLILAANLTTVSLQFLLFFVFRLGELTGCLQIKRNVGRSVWNSVCPPACVSLGAESIKQTWRFVLACATYIGLSVWARSRWLAIGVTNPAVLQPTEIRRKE